MRLKVLAVVLLFLMTLCVCYSFTTPKKGRVVTDTCFLGGYQYNLGDTWHPKLYPRSEDACVNCTCLKKGEVKCTAVQCPVPECANPKYVKGKCCPVCEVAEEESGGDAIEEAGCDFDGDRYDGGDTFPSNKTAYKPVDDNQCVLCGCLSGQVICHLKSCILDPRCIQTVKVVDDCCPQCQEMLVDTSSTLEEVNKTLEPGDCVSAAGRHQNGTRWKPVVGPFGQMDCVVCNCLNGHIDCARIKCPKDSSLKCRNPVLPEGACCKECPKNRKGKGKGRKKGKNRGRRCRAGDDSKKRKGRKKKCKAKGKRHKKSKLKSKDFLTDNVIKQLCLPAKADRLVYHVKAGSNEVIAFEGVKDHAFDTMQWAVKKGRHVTSNRKLPRQPDLFRKRVRLKDLLGAVTQKEAAKFMKRVQKKMRRCKQRCKRKVLQRLVAKLKVKKIDYKKAC